MYLKKIFPNNFNQIQDTVRLVAPFFGEFCLRINPYDQDKTELEWFEKGEDIPFRAYHLSDGTLRFMCLATLLLQPLEKQPDIIIIDEPELGLHPYAITVLASLIKSVSKLGKQVIISTQSVDLLSEFEPTDVIVVNREGSKSVLKRFDSLGELWKKNILGGRPA
jgi:predicted ATPase